MTIKQLLDANKSLQKVFNQDLKSIRINYAVSRLVEKYNSEVNLATQAIDKLQFECAVKDEDGKIIFNEKGGFNIEEDKQEDLKEEIDKFLEQKLDVEFYQIPFEVCVRAKLTPQDISLIKPFIAEPTEEEIDRLQSMMDNTKE